MMGKGAWVAGADRQEAPGPKPEHLGRRLRLRGQPLGLRQLLNGGDQRGVSTSSLKSRIQDVIAHELAEHETGSHEAALQSAPQTRLSTDDGAKRILRAVERSARTA